MKTSTLNLSFFWHMHQPDYRGSDGVMSMPWVFLHAIKDYYEMPWLLSEYPHLKATFNLSASLIEQLQLYNEPLKYDYFLSLWSQRPSLLENSQREWMIKLITAMQFETMVRPIERYAELYYQDSFSDEELIDLEVVFLLAWCGNYLRLHNREVKKLFEKKQGYTQRDKEGLLASLSSFVGEILPFYTSLQKKGIISVSTTPYFHPILPLLIDMENAKIANEHTQMPSGAYSLLEDAKEHVRLSIELYERTFGCRPKGFWPAEGAVDEKSVAIYQTEGIKWIATDEAILYRSLGDSDHSLRYRPYMYDEVTIGFRDHALSDLIGFEYRHRSPEEASRHFMEELKQIASHHDTPNVFVIVDGENAWEFYHNNGLDFFQGLYRAMSDAPWCTTKTMDEVAAQPDIPHLKHLFPGTWIHGTFDTWAGHREKNRAWELIFQTRRDAQPYVEKLSEETKEQVKYHLLASECSDWFWWYGDDHGTDFGKEFDQLFRDHLIQVYTLVGLAIPINLLEAILSECEQKPFWIKPSSPITVRLDGKQSSFFEWMGCGVIDEDKIFGAMDKMRGPVTKMYYGFDEVFVYGALEGEIRNGWEMFVEYNELKIPLKKFVSDKRLEFSFARDIFGLQRVVTFRIVIMDGTKTVQSLPGFGPLELDFDHKTDWFI